MLTLAATAERVSEHPLAQAIVRAATERSLPLGEVTEFEALPGRGISARGRQAGTAPQAMATEEAGRRRRRV